MVEEWLRLRDFGLRIHQERVAISEDIQRLSQKFEQACTNHQKASDYLRQLEQLRSQTNTWQEQWELEDLFRTHDARRHLYLQAAKRIYAILGLNHLFQLMLGEMTEHIHHALHSSLDMARALAAGQSPDRQSQQEFAQACGRLQSYQKLYEQVKSRPGLE